jgi:pimeloyl-ACP methyl ester carboxylesterase
VQEAFFFGPGEHRLFASYHPAAGLGGRVLTVICPPLFSDYMRTHQALRQTSVTLADRGQHVLRFDYRGTGDSFGDLGEFTVSDWVEDIALAVREGREISGCSVVRLLGVRASALLACAATRASGEVQRLVLWDPVPDGTSYLQVQRRLRQTMLQENYYLSRSDRRASMDEHAGYSLSTRMVEKFRLLDTSTYSSLPKNSLHVVSTSSAARFPVPGVPQDVTPFRCAWDTLANEVIMPRPVLERLVECLTRT